MNENPPGNASNAKIAPQVQAIVSLASAGNFSAAVAAANSIADRDVAISAWRLLSEMNANLQRWTEAISAIENALRRDPNSHPLRVSRALLLEQAGRTDESLSELESLAREAPHSPQLLVHLAALQSFAGRMDEAETLLVNALQRWPAHAALHTQLARLRWQRGAGLDSFRHLEQAIEQHPREMHLRLVAADLLRQAGAAERALGLLMRGLELVPDSAIFLTSAGALLEGMDRLDEAMKYLREAQRRAPRSPAVRRNLVPALLRSGAAAQARALCDELLLEFADDQLLVAQRATALRLLGDAEYGRLYDYARLVKSFMLQPTTPYTSILEFNAAFASELGKLHRGVRHPLEQSLRGGSQTERNLPRDNPVIAAFFSMLDAPIRAYMNALRAGDLSHPVDRRNSGDFRLSGSWSVQLQPGGYHIDHVHPRGWLSSAYYVTLPDVSDNDSRAGWIRFGEPGTRIAGCQAEHFVRPEPGMLVLFPSYMWHGTVPFGTGGTRLTAAFDVVPA